MSLLTSLLADDGAQFDYAATGPVQAFPAVAAWPSANNATLTKVRVSRPVLVSSIVVGIGTSSGNIDAGIYDLVGTTWTRRASAGSTAAAGTNALQTLAMTAPVWLTPGKDWWIAVVADNTTITLARAAFPSSIGLDSNQNFSKGSSFPLPATIVTPAASAYTPYARTAA